MTPELAAFIDRRPAPFTREERRAQAAHKLGLLTFILESTSGSVLIIPAVYSVALPLALLDIWTTAFQWICFPLVGIAKVRRRHYFAIDRHRLGYLNAIEKLHCLYCSYANGLIAYVREIAARTEQYACPIKHGHPITAAHDRYHLFVDYGDAEGYRRELEGLRRSLARRSGEPDRHAPRAND